MSDSRCRVPFLAILFCAARLCAENGVHDPEFDKVPFSAWLTQPQVGKWGWKPHVLPVILSPHQRLLAQIQIELNGSEAARRRGAGSLVFYFQFRDAKGQTWQDHATVDLTTVPRHPHAVTITESAFVLPGDYALTVVISDTATGEHSAKQEHLHVQSLDADPLPLLGKNLPPIEFVPKRVDPPDSWYLPNQQGRLDLPVHPSRPVRIELIMNRASNRWTGPDSDLAFLLPYLKVLSGMKGRNMRMNVSLIDVDRRRELFRQSAVETLDWKAMRPSVENIAAQIVDVRELAIRESRAVFLERVVARRLTSVGPEIPIIVVMSGAVYPEETGQTPSINVPGARVIYIRVRGGTLDQLAQVLNGAKVYDVITPLEFRHVLQKVVAAIDAR